MMAYPFKKMGGRGTWSNRKVPSNKEIIIEWLMLQPDRSLIHSHDIQKACISYASSMYDKMMNPSTLDRCWRQMREDNALDGTGLHIEEILSTNRGIGGREKSWLLTKDM